MMDADPVQWPVDHNPAEAAWHRSSRTCLVASSAEPTATTFAARLSSVSLTSARVSVVVSGKDVGAAPPSILLGANRTESLMKHMQLRAEGVQLFAVNMKPVGELAQPISIVAVLQAGQFRHKRISVDREPIPLRP